jgi:succinylglutamate desuccinylase
LANEVPDIELHRRRLSNATAGIPSVIEIRHREKLVLKDTFEMVGDREYRSFDVVHKGTLVARRNGRDVLAPETGRLLLPLYQGQGSDGFFIGRRVRPFWLALSKWLRRIRFSRTLLLLLPGVHRHPTLPDAFVVDPRIARTKPVEVFHLLGFRRRRWEDGKLVFTRRNEGTPRVL